MGSAGCPSWLTASETCVWGAVTSTPAHLS